VATPPSAVSIGPNSELRAALIDLCQMVASLLGQRPTCVNEEVDQELDCIDSCDASAFGAGGVWFNGKSEPPPIIWRL
jgi:hypothetical protein